MAEYEHLSHGFGPVCDENSAVLIIGSFPSVKSREQQFYYGHPQNRFWKVLAAVFASPLPVTVEEKKRFVLENRVALWDVIDSCDIIGSSDSSIKNVIPADISSLAAKYGIERIFCNGGRSYELYMKHVFPTSHIPAAKLPSTSPANAAFSLEKLVEHWRQIR